MRAQISVETLLVFLIFLIVLGTAVYSAMRVGGIVKERTDSLQFRNSYNEFSSKLSEVCSLGNENKRKVEIAGSASLEKTGENSLAFSIGNKTDDIGSICDFLDVDENPSAVFYIENVGGKIEISVP